MRLYTNTTRKTGLFLVTDTKARTGGSEYLRRRSEEQVKLDKIKEVLNKFDITFPVKDELENALGKETFRSSQSM